MNSDEYLFSILQKYKVNEYQAKLYAKVIQSDIKLWADNWERGCLKDVCISGSFAKTTAVSNGTDIDLFISLSSTTSGTLKEIYNDLFSYMDKGHEVRKQNVSIGIFGESSKIDLVPGKRQSQYGNDHSLYIRKRDTWQKTNIQKHITQVSNSGRTNEIKLLKIWRNNKKLEFPSFYLELVVMDALYNARIGELSQNFHKIFQFLSTNFLTAVYKDPANTANTISADLSDAERKIVADAAQDELQKQYWSQIIN